MNGDEFCNNSKRWLAQKNATTDIGILIGPARHIAVTVPEIWFIMGESKSCKTLPVCNCLSVLLSVALVSAWHSQKRIGRYRHKKCDQNVKVGTTANTLSIEQILHLWDDHKLCLIMKFVICYGLQRSAFFCEFEMRKKKQLSKKCQPQAEWMYERRHLNIRKNMHLSAKFMGVFFVAL